MKERYSKIINRMTVSEEYRNFIHVAWTCFLLGAVGTIMFIVNIFTGTDLMTAVTGIMAFTGMAMCFYVAETKKLLLPRVIMFFIFFSGLVFFIYSGGQDGFSPYWACLFPFLSIAFYGMRNGIRVGLMVLLIIMIMLWTPVSGMLAYRYSDVFIIRYPILYGCLFFTVAGADIMRNNSFLKLRGVVGELEELTKTDELTGMENRRAFRKRLSDLWSVLSHRNDRLAILMVDVDSFKNYNDFYGHLKGDRALREIADILTGVAERQKAYVSRWGGEEFVLLLPFADEKAVCRVADIILREVRAASLFHGGINSSEKIVTVSVGAAVADVSGEIAPSYVIEQADFAMYEAKEAGGNRLAKVRLLGREQSA